MIDRVMKLVSDKYVLSDISKKYLRSNLNYGSRNLFLFYQATDIEKKETYPVATLLFLLSDAKEILSETKGELYLFYHSPQVISRVYKDEFYSSPDGIEIYNRQLRNIKTLSREILGLELNLVNLQEYVENSKEVASVYALLKDKHLFNENILFWLNHFSKPAVEEILKDVFSRVKATSLMNHLFIKKGEKYVKSVELVNSKYKEIVKHPNFEKYLVYELLASVSVPYTHNTLLRPNLGANLSMQEWAQTISSDLLQSNYEIIKNTFENRKYYVSVDGVNGLNLPFSFVHPIKNEKGIKLKLERTNNIARLEDVLVVLKPEKTNSITESEKDWIVDFDYEQDYFSAFDKRFPNWKILIEKIMKFNRANEILPSNNVVAEEINSVKVIEINKTDIPGEIQELVLKREKARQEKNWEFADRIRAELLELGYYVEDKPVSNL